MIGGVEPAGPQAWLIQGLVKDPWKGTFSLSVLLPDSGRRRKPLTSRLLSDKVFPEQLSKKDLLFCYHAAPEPFLVWKRHLGSIFAESTKGSSPWPVRNPVLHLHGCVVGQWQSGTTGGTGDLRTLSGTWCYSPDWLTSAPTWKGNGPHGSPTSMQGPHRTWVTPEGCAARPKPALPSTRLDSLVQEGKHPTAGVRSSLVKHGSDIFQQSILTSFTWSWKKPLRHGLSRACPRGSNDVWVDSPGTLWGMQRACVSLHRSFLGHSLCCPHLHKPVTPSSRQLLGLAAPRSLRRQSITTFVCCHRLSRVYLLPTSAGALSLQRCQQ